MVNKPIRFSLIELGWCDGGPMIDLLSFGDDDSWSLFCLNVTPMHAMAYLEVFGLVLFNNYPDKCDSNSTGQE